MSGISLTRFRQPLIALLCAVGMSCSASGVLPAAVALVGQLDSDHEVVVTPSGEDLEIRFHHHDETRAGQTADEEVAVTTASRSEDHVIQFTSPGQALTQLSSQIALENISKCIATMQTGQWNPIARSSVAASHARPPPGKATLDRCLSSVVLLV